MIRRLVTLIAVLGLMLATVPAVAGAGNSDLARARAATARFHNVDAALAAGYIQVSPCVESPAGGMGFHYLNPALLDGTLDPTQPELLNYAPSPSGGLRLASLEYMIPTLDQSLPPTADPVRPSLFGVPFDGPMVGHGPGVPVHYDLHVWLWQHNPAGMFATWNPALDCIGG